MNVICSTIQNNLDNVETLFNIIQAGVTSAAIIAGGIWAFFKFKIFRENKSLIDFSVDIVFHSQIKDSWIIELIAYIENKGKVQHKIQEFNFVVSTINNQDNVETTDKYGGQVFFPNEISKGSFLAKDYTCFFIEPGLKNKYSFIASLPLETELVLMHSWFKYLDGKHIHTAEITKKIPTYKITLDNERV